VELSAPPNKMNWPVAASKGLGPPDRCLGEEAGSRFDQVRPFQPQISLLYFVAADEAAEHD
jgi:hypothetical protein